MAHRPHPFKGFFTDVKKVHAPKAVGATAESPDLPEPLMVSPSRQLTNTRSNELGGGVRLTAPVGPGILVSVSNSLQHPADFEPVSLGDSHLTPVGSPRQVPGIQEFWSRYNRRKGNPHHKALLFRKEVVLEPEIKTTPMTPIFGSHIDKRAALFLRHFDTTAGAVR
jgi:hypothetical protein